MQGHVFHEPLTSCYSYLSTDEEPTSEKSGAAIENVADAVTHARFVGTDPSNDEVVLMKILHVSLFRKQEAQGPL